VRVEIAQHFVDMPNRHIAFSNDLEHATSHRGVRDDECEFSFRFARAAMEGAGLVVADHLFTARNNRVSLVVFSVFDARGFSGGLIPSADTLAGLVEAIAREEHLIGVMINQDDVNHFGFICAVFTNKEGSNLRVLFCLCVLLATGDSGDEVI